MSDEQVEIKKGNKALKPRVLVVDDEQAALILMKKVIQKLDCEVVVATNGWDAITLAKENLFALIILDVLMPDINGYETLVRIKSSTINKETPVFFMTGMDTDQDILLKAYNTGAIDFIQKPTNLNILQRKVGYFLDYFNQKEELRLARIKSDELVKTRMSLIANITHELRTPLFAMLGMIDVYKQNPSEFEKDSLVDKIQINSENLLDTVNEFLDFSKTSQANTAIDLEYFSLKKMCRDVINLMNYQYHKNENVELKLSIDKDIPDFVRADKKKIRHILLNLFSNALKFTNKGIVRLDIKNVGSRDGKMLIKFILEDSGVGISKDNLKTVFEEYSQVDNELQGSTVGTGLGLTICKQLVTILNGKLRVSSEIGIGTKFSFSIPIEPGTESDLQEIKESHSLEELLGDRHINVLIVDDVPDNLFVLKNYLNTPKINLELDHDPISGLEKLKKNNYDIALLDINMPKMDGFEVATQYNQSITDDNTGNVTQLVALTAFSYSEELKEKLDSAGFYSYLMKPVRKEQLYKMIVSVTHNLEKTGFTKISAFKDEEEKRDYNFDLLDADFVEYLPTYLNNKIKEVDSLKAFIINKDDGGVCSICHKILGTAKSFGLFRVDREIEEAHKLAKSDFAKHYKEIENLVNSSSEHLNELKKLIPS